MEAWWIRCGDGSAVYDGGSGHAPRHHDPRRRRRGCKAARELCTYVDLGRERTLVQELGMRASAP